MKENFHNLAKEVDFQEVQEDQRAPKSLGLRKHTPSYIIIILHKIKDKERIFQAAREKETVTYKGVPIRLSADVSQETLQARRGWQEVLSHERQGPTPKITLSSKAFIWNGRADKCFPDKVKLKEFIITKPLLYKMLKGLI